MSSRLNRLLVGLHQESYFNKVGYSAPFISFFAMQMVRIISLALIFILWCVEFYITVKKCIMYLNFWGLTFTMLALGYMFVASGRQVIERKMRERGQ